MNNFDLKLYLANNPLLMEAEDVDLENSLKSVFNDIEKEMEVSKEKLTESAGLAIAGTALAIPELMKIIGGVTKKVNKFFGGKGATGDKIISIADKLHHFLVGIIEKGLKVLGMKDSNAIHKTANIIFHVIIASLMITSGLGAYKAVKSANLSHATLEGALAAVKNGEVSKFIAKELGGLAKVAPEAGTLATTALSTTA